MPGALSGRGDSGGVPEEFPEGAAVPPGGHKGDSGRTDGEDDPGLRRDEV